jgi:hypothetical protein
MVHLTCKPEEPKELRVLSIKEKLHFTLFKGYKSFRPVRLKLCTKVPIRT